jgi:hypothetical protein
MAASRGSKSNIATLPARDLDSAAIARPQVLMPFVSIFKFLLYIKRGGALNIYIELLIYFV